jgi:uncharacterized protein DUF922
MSDRSHLEDASHPVRALQAAAQREEELERLAPEAALDPARGPEQPRRDAVPISARAIGGLQASAGNAAVVSLLQGRARSHHDVGSPAPHAGRSALVDAPAVQRAPGDEEQPLDPNPTTAPNVTADPNALAGGTGSTGDATGGTGDPTGGTGATSTLASGDTGATQTGTGTTTPGGSWTMVGPPTPAHYDVSGSLRTVANAIAARKEAGSVTPTMTTDTTTWEPPGGTEKVKEARVTVDQVLELPNWTDKANATANQQKEWDRFFAAITTHENGHVAIDKTSFAGTHSKMIGQTPADAKTKADAVEAQATTDNDTYDTTNGHGVKQGTGINPNIDEVTKVPSNP